MRTAATILVAVLIATAGCKKPPDKPAVTPSAPQRHPQFAAVRAVIDVLQPRVQLLRDQLASPKSRQVMRVAIQEYLYVMHGIDLSGCPDNFARAFTAALDAWDDFAEVLTDPDAPTAEAAA